MAKNDEKIDSPKGIWDKLGRNKLVMVQETDDEMMKRRSETNMEKALVQGNPTFQPLGYPII